MSLIPPPDIQMVLSIKHREAVVEEIPVMDVAKILAAYLAEGSSEDEAVRRLEQVIESKFRRA